MSVQRLTGVFAVALAGIFFWSSIPAHAQLGLGKLKKNDEAKEEKREEKEAKQYDTLSEYAQHLYEEDSDFHDLVDLAYHACQGEHAELAYRVNTSPAYTTRVSLDAFRIPEGETQGERELQRAATLGAGMRAAEESAISACTTQVILRPRYGNPRIQEYVNRVGQQLVPTGSDKLYAFRVTMAPIPYAYTLSTGTIYISTGLISMTDNEAQLAYILSHEIAHVDKDHWKMKIMDNLAVEKYNQKQQLKKAAWGTAIGAAIGLAAGRSGGAVAGGAVLGGVTGAVVGRLTTIKQVGLDWSDAQENEADDFALQNTLNRNYDVQEVPKLYAALKVIGTADQRVSLGFIANPARIGQRMSYAQKQLQTPPLKTDYEKKLNASQLIGTSPSYELMMADLKRDNGIVALDFDMFSMAKQNLSQAVNLRTDDALSHFYYGTVLKLVGRTDGDQQKAKTEFTAAIKLDQQRHAIPEADLAQALLLMDAQDSGSQGEATQALKSYIVDYQRRSIENSKLGDTVPHNLNTLYDYLRLLGEPKWTAPDPPADYYQLVTGGGGVETTRAVAYVKSDSKH